MADILRSSHLLHVAPPGSHPCQAGLQMPLALLLSLSISHSLVITENISLIAAAAVLFEVNGRLGR